MVDVSIADDQAEQINAVKQAETDQLDLQSGGADVGESFIPDPVEAPQPDNTVGGLVTRRTKRVDTAPAVRVDAAPEVVSRDTTVDKTVGGLVTPQASTAETVVKSTASGFLRAGLLLPGAIMGGLAGTAIAGPFGTIVGGLTGLIATAWAGENAAKSLEEQGLGANPIDVDVRDKPAAVFGQLLGASFAGGGTVFVVAKTGLRLSQSIVGNFINRTLDWAKTNPLRFAFLESTSAVSAGGAEAVYESVDPDNPIPRTGVGLAAGVLNPTNMTVFFARKIYHGLRAAKSAAGGTFGIDAAGRELSRLWAAAGEDPETLVRILADTQALERLIPGLTEGGTLAQRTGHPAVVRLEANLAARDQKFYAHRQGVGDATLEALLNTIKLLKASGSPGNLQEAAKLWRGRYESALERLVGYAEIEARAAVGRILKEGDTAVDEGRISAEVTEVLANSLSVARGVERELWAAAGKGMDSPATWQSALKLKAILEGDLPVSVKLPQIMLDQFQALKEAGDLIKAAELGARIPAARLKEARNLFTVKELLLFRGELLEAARDVPVTQHKIARRLGLMAEALLDDVVRAGASTKSKKSVAGTTPLDDARAFSRMLNDIYLRTFLGQIRKETAYGYTVPAEVVLRTAMASGGPKAALRFEELTEGANFIPVRKLSDGGTTLFREQMAQMNQNSKLLYDLQSRFLRIAADAAVDEETGRLSIKSLRAFMKKSAAVLQRFPEVKADLDNAIRSERNFAKWANILTGNKKALDDGKGIIGGLLGTESAPEYIRGVMGGKTPIAKLDEALNLARGSTGGLDAEDGLRLSIWETIFGSATRSDGAIDLDVLLHVLNAPIKPGLMSIREYMVTRGLLAPEDSNVIAQIGKLEQNLRAAIAGQVTGEEITTTPSMFFNFALRLGGAEAGGQALDIGQKLVGTSGNMASSLIARTRGSQLAVDLIERMPRKGIRQMLVDALSGAPLVPNGERWGLLKELMKNVEDPAVASQSAIRLHAYAWAAGLLGAEDEVRLLTEDQPGVPEDKSVGGLVSPAETGFDKFKKLFFRQQSSPIPGIIE